MKPKFYYYKIGKYDPIYGEISADYAKCNIPVNHESLCRLMGLYGPAYHVEQITEEEYLQELDKLCDNYEKN